MDQEKETKRQAERCRALAQRIVRELTPASIQAVSYTHLERFWAAFLFLLSFLYFGVFWEDAESFSVVDPLTAWHIACKHRLPYESRCFFAVALSPGDYYTYKKGRVLQGQEGKRMARNKTAQGGICLLYTSRCV